MLDFMNKPIKTIEAYLAAVPVETRTRLLQLRQIILTTAPLAKEKISYGMPFYEYKGRLVYFRLAKAHLGLYIPPPVIADFKKELKGYKTATATIQFPLDEQLPVALIKKLIKARMKINEERMKVKIRPSSKI